MEEGTATKEKTVADEHPLFTMDFDYGSSTDEGSTKVDPESIDKNVEKLLADHLDTGIAATSKDKAPDPPAVVPPAPTVSDPAAPKTDDDVQGASQHALLALSYQKTHKAIAEDVVIPKDLTAEGLQDLLVTSRLKGEEKKVDDLVALAKERLAKDGLNEERMKMLAHLENGGDPNVVSRYVELNKWANDDLKDEEDMLETIRFDAELRGQKSEFVEAYIANNLVENPEALKKAAEDAQVSIGEVAKQEFERDKERRQLEIKQENDNWTAFTSGVKTIVKQGFNGIKLPASEEADLINYMTVKNQTLDIIKDGKPKRIPVTQYEFDGQELKKASEKNVLFAYQLMKGDKAIVNEANRTAHDKFLAAASEQAKEENNKKPLAKIPANSTGELVMAVEFED